MRCGRCRHVLRTGRAAAVETQLALAVAAPPLMVVGLGASFISLSGGGVFREASVLDAAAAMATGNALVLALAVGAAIVALPVLRAAALIYALAPLTLRRPPARHAARAFRLAVELRPWAMAEIFLIGVAVALVKVAGLAAVSLGPAFWSFVLLAALALIEDASICERTIWDAVA
ncbi:MAG: paraquat-inducible protein A [Pseudomonadota bacterium]